MSVHTCVYICIRNICKYLYMYIYTYERVYTLIVPNKKANLPILNRYLLFVNVFNSYTCDYTYTHSMYIRKCTHTRVLETHLHVHVRTEIC